MVQVLGKNSLIFDRQNFGLEFQESFKRSGAATIGRYLITVRVHSSIRLRIWGSSRCRCRPQYFESLSLAVPAISHEARLSYQTQPYQYNPQVSR